MKLDSDINYNQLSSFYQKELRLLDAKSIKQAMWVLIILLYDLPLLLGLIMIGKIEFFWILLPMIIVIHLWGIRHAFKNVYSTQVESVLFMAIFSVLASISLLIVVIGLLIYVLVVPSIYYYLLFALFTSIPTYLIIKTQLDKRLRDPLEKGYKKRNTKYDRIAYSAGGVGVVLAGVVRGNLPLENIVTTGVIYSFYFIFVYFAAKYLYKYQLIKANIHLVKFQQPSRKDQYKLKEKGVKIK